MKHRGCSHACLAFVALLAAPVCAHEPGPHVHGVAKLQVAVDGNTLTLNLESPLDNLLGFEHMPRTDKEKASVHALNERLNKAESVFVPTPAARCVAGKATLDSPVFKPPSTDKGGGSGHMDLDAEFTFRCEAPDKLRSLEVRLFAGYPMRRIDVQVAGPRGQVAARLTPALQSVAW